MLYLFISLVFVFFVQDVSTTNNQCNPKTLCGCSRHPPNRAKVVNGSDAYNYTWAVSIRNRTNHHICGGSILNEWYIITAAHCFDYPQELSTINICAGTRSLSAPCRQYREVHNITIHPSYTDDKTYENDIALIKLKIHLNFTDLLIARICLPNVTRGKEYPMPDTNVTAVGWGLNGSGQMADTLQQITIRVMNGSEETCDDMVASSHDIKLCASSPGKGKILLFNSCSISILVF